jgi:predicted nucleic acid-binding protein
MLYLDASALVKRYLAEDGSEAVLDAMEGARALSMCRVGFVETLRAVGQVGEPRDVKRFERDWLSIDVVEVDGTLAERAAELALSHRLRSLDALHLAAALGLPGRDLTVATWDARLHHAAAEQGLRTLPAVLG